MGAHKLGEEPEDRERQGQAQGHRQQVGGQPQRQPQPCGPVSLSVCEAGRVSQASVPHQRHQSRQAPTRIRDSHHERRAAPYDGAGQCLPPTICCTQERQSRFTWTWRAAIPYEHNKTSSNGSGSRLRVPKGEHRRRRNQWLPRGHSWQTI